MIYWKNGILLIYVIRDNTTNSFNTSYKSRIDCLVQCIQHISHNCESDNSDFFSLLTQYTENTEGYSRISLYTRRRDGRVSWIALLNHFEGVTFRKVLSQEAMKMLKQPTYSGSRRNFYFGDYYNRHTMAHLKSVQANTPLTL